MIQSAHRYSIAELFEPESKVRYRVPRYQRAYSWTMKDWNNLFDDLYDNRGGHFLGSIICINRSKDALGDTDLEIVDGQQRLATLSLLYAAIHERMLNMCQTEDSEELIVGRVNIRHRICRKKDDAVRVCLSHQKGNDADYRAVLRAAGILKDVSAVVTSDVRAGPIYRAYHHFMKRISVLSAGEFADLVDLVNQAEVVKIEVDSSSDAFVLFESLNDRGEALTAMDLIKNKALATIETLNSNVVDQAADQWATMASRIPEVAKYQERFLRQAYNCRSDTPLTKNENARLATRSNLIQVYESLIESDVFAVVEDLEVKSLMNEAFLYPDKAQGELAQFRDGLSDLLHVQAAPAYTVVFYLLMERSSDPSLIQDIVGLLVKYFLRRSVTDFPQTRKLDPMLMELIDYCRHAEHPSVEEIRDFLVQDARSSSDVRFRECLENDLYEQNVDATRFILCSIERAHQTKETKNDLWRRDGKDSFIWTIEHILPEGVNLPQSWVDMMGAGNAEEARRMQSQWMHKLGNLTLSAYNAALSNDPFIAKRDRKDARGNWVGYRNGTCLNTGIALKDAWTVTDIQQRTRRLVDEAMELFRL
jgi:hypothetical protein